jgi:hypothetical protein
MLDLKNRHSKQIHIKIVRCLSIRFYLKRRTNGVTNLQIGKYIEVLDIIVVEFSFQIRKKKKLN